MKEGGKKKKEVMRTEDEESSFRSGKTVKEDGKGIDCIMERKNRRNRSKKSRINANT